MASEKLDWKDLPPLGKTVLVVFGVLGYLVGWYCRAQLELSGAVPGAIFGALGTGGGVAVGYVVITFVPGCRR